MQELAKRALPLAVFMPAEEGGYNVSFPNFPGCVTFGRTFEEAKAMAQDVLELWLEEMSARGEPIKFEARRPIVDEVAIRLPIRRKAKYAVPSRQKARAHS